MSAGDWGVEDWGGSANSADDSEDAATAQHAEWMGNGIEAEDAEVDDVDLGEDPPVDELTGELLDEPAGPRVSGADRPQRVLGVDVGSLATHAVDEAVQAAVQRQVAKIAQESVAKALTPEVLAALRVRAQEATTAAVSEHVAQDGTKALADADEPSLHYGSVDEFVREHLRVVYRPRIDGKNRLWSAQWWKYPEARIRLEAIWRAWEHLRLDPATGVSVWWRDHADYHLGVLTSPATSPFPAVYDDSVNTSEFGDPLPYIAPPKELFPDTRVARPSSGEEPGD
jgi:hypothetical protein